MEGFILAGGRSRRFGEDKLLYTIGHKRLIECTVDALRGLCHRICLVTKDVKKFSFLEGVELIEDFLEKQCALSGIHTALRNLKNTKGLIVAGDMPLIRKNLLETLIQKAEPPLTLFRIGGKLQPLLAVYYKELLPYVEAYITSGGERLVDFVEKAVHKELDEKDASESDPELLSFLNVNTKEDAEFILKTYGREGF
ncbi:MAG: molybdenum cofactor guanylyltransferase [Aquificaceae bacterium]|nr:molybdenum cofactor guanylyltransferase [Aquificaceae bacterium]